VNERRVDDRDEYAVRDRRNVESKVRPMLITATNMIKVKQLLDFAKRFLTRNHDHLRVLEEELECAEVVSPETIPPDVITINTQALIHDLGVGRQTVYALVLPRDADVAKNKISVLSPVGTVLLGYRVGDLIECVAPAAMKRLRVKQIVYQPEAARNAG
jgi:regulator of nucleoside diphosphate kinase